MFQHWIEIRNSGILIEAGEHPDSNHAYHKRTSYRAEEHPEVKTRFKVLIVEDERLIAENVKFILEEKGYEVVGIAASGIDAVLQARTKFPDLVLMDVRIQGPIDGIEAVEQIRSVYNSDLPVLFLSAYPAEQFPHLKHLEADSFRYLRKPYSPFELISEIRNLIARH